MSGFPADWVEYGDGSWGPPGKRLPRPAGQGIPRANRGSRRSFDGTEDDPEVLARRKVDTFEEEFRSRPTVYRGIQFRSRIEARWAITFDFFSLGWEFEPEHYEIPGVGNYLPDFWLQGQDCWIEIKGPHPTEFEQAKARGLARLSQKVVYIFCCGIPRIGPDGAPWDFQCGKDLWAHGYRYNPDGTEAMGYMFGVKECCGTLGIVQDAQTPRIQCDCDPSVAEWDDNYLKTLQIGLMRGRKARWD